jgi:Flp pilus assembly protein TadG
VNERGSAVVEFAIVSTVVLTMMLGIIDFGRGLYTYHLVYNAARSGTRYAIVRGSSCSAPGCPATSDQIQTYVRGLAPGIDPASLTVTTTWATATACAGSPYQGPGCLASVQVSYPFHFLVPLLPGFTMTMSSTSQMVISQ